MQQVTSPSRSGVSNASFLSSIKVNTGLSPLALQQSASNISQTLESGAQHNMPASRLRPRQRNGRSNNGNHSLLPQQSDAIMKHTPTAQRRAGTGSSPDAEATRYASGSATRDQGRSWGGGYVMLYQ